MSVPAGAPQEPQNQTPPPTPQAPPPTATPAGQQGADEAKFTQADIDRIVKDRLDRERKSAEEKAKKDKETADVAELVKQGEFEKLANERANRIAELEAKAAARDHEDLKRSVALAAKLPEELAKRLTGSTKDELETDAKELAKLVKTDEDRTPQRGNSPGPRPAGTGNNTVEAREAVLRKSGRYPGL